MAQSDPADRFVWKEGDLTISQCVRCRHKHTSGATCTAFLDRIPEAILTNTHDHRRPYPGDRGVRFEEIDRQIEGLEKILDT